VADWRGVPLRGWPCRPTARRAGGETASSYAQEQECELPCELLLRATASLRFVSIAARRAGRESERNHAFFIALAAHQHVSHVELEVFETGVGDFETRTPPA